jgi:hypothetical protein
MLREIRPGMSRLLIWLTIASASLITPASAADNNNKNVYEIPASTVRAMTPQQREQAKASAAFAGALLRANNFLTEKSLLGRIDVLCRIERGRATDFRREWAAPSALS